VRSSKALAATGLGESTMPLRLTGASWLSDSALLLVGTHDGALPLITKASLVRSDARAEFRIRWFQPRSGRDPKADAPARWIAVVHGNGRLRAGSAFGLTLSTEEQSWQFDPSSVAGAITDLRTLVRTHFTALGPDERSVIVEFLASSAKDADSEPPDRLRLSRSLNVARDMLRERLPICDLRPNRIEGLAVEAVMGLDEKSFYIEGWLCDGESEAIRMTAVSPEGSRTEILGSLFRYRRPDAEEFFKGAIGDQPVAKYGFISYFSVSAPSLLPSGWLVEVETAAGTAIEAIGPQLITNAGRIRTELLSDLAHDVGLDQQLRRSHISPAMSTLQLRRSRSIRVDREVQLGEQPPRPRVSIIVPLYGRIDLLEHQMAQFADDPELHNAELIYVLDSPELKSDLLMMAEGLFRLYRLPFKVIVLSENGGYSTANNIAASCARGNLLLLLNSDILPARAGWLSGLAEFYEALDSPGALGPKLIYEDNSLQHAGLYFECAAGSTVWMNEHFYKGLHTDLPAANVARVVPAVTGACLMIDARLYAEVGGLSGVYIQGDYEDSDLCLRLADAGHENWYFPGVDLYHLEGQSYPTTARQANYDYNRWLFNETWAEAIRAANVKAGLPNGAAFQIAAQAPGRKRLRAPQLASTRLLNGTGKSGESSTTRTKVPKALAPIADTEPPRKE
jgi:GT2 family glycosyltransferase